MAYVRATNELPHFSDEEVEQVAIPYGFGPADQPASGDSDGTELGAERTEVELEKRE
ncbi:hypothetical protein ASPFODRAFT_54807 [Aspergillus luchuensis CBS 106.47]|uniref:Uncharacterized protein n=1 Tax=Aspergillus luchuensis (strain CBS 106.47) TaxID=1137211 RepID=A0A1M3SYV5_ASPLC|nr:hypothetical protein ASPFODRAFT_54807 [Aspergillus luchuensis CBS 106.47]